MPAEPKIKRCIAFFDGQNLFHAAQSAFGYWEPNFEPVALAKAICSGRNWDLAQVRFYTGIHAIQKNAFWHHYWINKLTVLGGGGVQVFHRLLRYRPKTVELPGNRQFTFEAAEEKGIDVRIALDLIRLGLRGQYDVALIFSQDQDLSEVAEEIRTIATEQDRWIKVASAYPAAAGYRNARGINKTDWIPIDKALYDACIDQRDYRPKRLGKEHG